MSTEHLPNIKAIIALWFAAGMLPALGASIEGRVTKSVTAEPVMGTTVRAIDKHSYVFTATTDSSGRAREVNG